MPQSACCAGWWSGSGNGVKAGGVSGESGYSRWQSRRARRSEPDWQRALPALVGRRGSTENRAFLGLSFLPKNMFGIFLGWTAFVQPALVSLRHESDI